MIDPASLKVGFGKAPKRRRPDRAPAPAHSPFLILHGSTLLDAAGEVALWARFTGRDTEETEDARE